jgi:acyl-CoA synthetase (AMP-forming)/AMP-acid ligase II
METFHAKWLPVWERAASKPAVIDGGVTRTFAEHQDRVFRLVDVLGSQLGVESDSRYAVLALNSAAYLELYAAAYFGGGIINPLNIRLAAAEIEFILKDSGTEVVFVDQTFAPVLEKIGWDKVVRLESEYEPLLAAATGNEPRPTDESDVVCLMYTGGTTGLPKGVMHTQFSHNAQPRVGQRLMGFDEASVYFCPTPMFHAASFPAYNQAPGLGLPVAIAPMYSPDNVMDGIEATGATHTLLVPTMARMLLDAPNFDAARLASLRLVMYGGSPMPLGVLTRLMDALPNIDVVQLYGMTEGLPVSCLNGEDHRKGGDRLRSAGQIPDGVELTIQDEDGNVLPTGVAGEVCVKSEIYMTGYWNRPDETEAAFASGWYHSGDVGYLDDEGYLFLVDRSKDMIVTGGENVYTSEVESAISTHPAVADVAVIGIPSDDWGEAVHAVVVVRDGESVTEGELIAYARESIAGYKVPRSVTLRAEPLPVSGAGKTLKRELREPYWEGVDRRVN